MKKYINYIGPILTDAEYHGLGNPNEYLEIHLSDNLPFRIYCKMDDDCWEEVTEERSKELIAELQDKKLKLSRNDYNYYMCDFYLASLGVR